MTPAEIAVVEVAETLTGPTFWRFLTLAGDIGDEHGEPTDQAMFTARLDTLVELAVKHSPRLTRRALEIVASQAEQLVGDADNPAIVAARWASKLQWQPKREYAQACIAAWHAGSEWPQDPSGEWADKVRSRLYRFGVQQ